MSAAAGGWRPAAELVDAVESGRLLQPRAARSLQVVTPARRAAVALALHLMREVQTGRAEVGDLDHAAEALAAAFAETPPEARGPRPEARGPRPEARGHQDLERRWCCVNSDPAGQVSVPFNRRLRAPHQAQLEVLDRMIRDAGEVYGSDDQRTGALTSARAALYATGMLHWLIGQLDQADAIPPMFEDMVRAHQRQLDGILDGTPVHVVQETLG